MTTVAQRSFSSGEIAPALYARVDQSKYASGLRTCRNGFILRHGGWANRPGSKFIGEVKDSTKTVRLIPFIFNVDQTYVLEFGDEYFRVIRNGAYASDLSLTITGITQANPAVLTYTGTDPSNGEEVAISGVVGMTQVNGRNFKIANVNSGANTFELQYMNGTNVNSTAFTAYSSGGTADRIYTVSTPYLEADLPTLKYTQSADIVTLVHPSYAPRELARTGHTSWTLTTITFAPTQAAPTSPAASGGPGTATQYQVTAVASETYEESLPTSTFGTTSTPSAGSPVTLTWVAASGAIAYNVYRFLNGVAGFIGTAGSTSFSDVGLTADTSDAPPSARNPFGSTDNYPSTVTYLQQRLTFANTNNDPEKVWSSRTGLFKNFTISTPLQDDDAVTFTLAGRQVNEIRNLVDLGAPVIFTTSGEWAIGGNSAGVLVPAEVNPKQQSYNGSSELQPIIIGSSAIYVQARGSIVRDLAFEFQSDGYRGTDLTIFSAHLFDDYEIVDWAYQQIPHSVVWLIRNDGTMLSLTYVREQQILGWSRHDTSGTFENVAVVPEGADDALYTVVKRTINGETVRYVERQPTRQIVDIEESIFVDSSLSFDGRNTNTGHTMTLSGGTDWDYEETLTLTSSASFFESNVVGNVIRLVGSAGDIIRCEITAYTSATVVSVKPNATVPVTMRSAAISDWTECVDTVTGLWHLEGEDVSVFGDGFVVANPNNESYDIVTVTNGSVVLDKPYGVIHIGLPYISDIETLDIDQSGGVSIVDRKKNISEVSVFCENSRGIWVGATPPTNDSTDPLEGLYEAKIRNSEGYNEPVDLLTGHVQVNLRSEWNSNGRIFIRQVDPVPLTVLAVMPAGEIPFIRTA